MRLNILTASLHYIVVVVVVVVLFCFVFRSQARRFMVTYSVINKAAIMQPSLPSTVPPGNSSSVWIKKQATSWSAGTMVWNFFLARGTKPPYKLYFPATV